MYKTVVSDEEILGGEPRVDGTRIAVRHIAEMIDVAGKHPAKVAAEFGLQEHQVYEAMAYYHRNTDEFRRIRREHKRIRENSDSVSSPEDLGVVDH